MSATILPAAAYLRQSSDQQDTSIPDQRAAVRSYAEQHGYQITREFTDIESGWKDREGFAELLEAAEGRQFRAVLIRDQSRFSRFGAARFVRYVDQLAELGVQVISTREGLIDLDNVASFITSSVEQFGHADYVKTLAKNTSAGRWRAAREGRWLGPPPLGYAKDPDGNLVPGDLAEAVRTIYRLALDGYSQAAIADHLTKQLGDRSWQQSTVQGVLRNPVYKGTFVYGLRNKARFAQRQENAIVFHHHHEAIVSEEDWELVQSRLSRRGKRRSARQSGELVLSGLLRCGWCGSPMGVHGGRAAYRCTRHRTNRLKTDCPGNVVRQAEVLPVVIDAITGYFHQPGIRGELEAELLKQLSPAGGDDSETVRRQLGQVRGNLDRARRNLALVDPDLIGDVQQTIRSLKARQDELEQALAASETPREALERQAADQVDSILLAYDRLREKLAEDDLAGLRDLLLETIDHVEVWTEKQGSKYVLQRGIIHLSQVTEAPWGHGHSRGLTIPFKVAA